MADRERDLAWVMAMTRALGPDSKFSVPLVPHEATFRELFESLRRAHLGSLPTEPVPMLLWCPACGERHIDKGVFAEKVHHTHACQWCGVVWRPAVVATVGVEFLPGFKDG